MKAIHVSLLVGATALASVAFPWSARRAQAADPGAPPMLDVTQLKPGTKGYGLTVFSGTDPERFDVEVIGVLKNFLPYQDLILVKTKHPRLDVAKVIAGMSGSPVFIDGKMVGAYA
ncbi:MAG TPA: SpoIVB peptidase S55 domain-containing protein, partial [Polyangiaceae bacterium]|nr:SpoIVB peptidase S55 domain-containing protein [Polyangiaceae bacterium]